MAKFRVAYGLCPLIDSCSLLGVNVDRDTDCVIVTIGRNIVIRYKFQDQKQVNSWSSKDKLTSSVIYNSFNSVYTAIFNQDQLRMWKEEDQLDKVKKYKFQEPLHSVIPDPDGNDAFVLFRCGHVATITQALETRKVAVENPILSSNETIKDNTVLTYNGVKYIAFISCRDETELNLNVVPVVYGTSTLRYSLSHANTGKIIVGHTIMSKNDSGFLLSLWSDGSLFSFNFLPDTEESFPGAFIQKITSVNTKHPVAVTTVGHSHLAFFGADCSEEGAMLILFNLQFELIQARLHFKLYSKPPRMWNVNNHLLLTVGNNLIAVPYLLEVEQLSNLVGIHSSSILSRIEASWGNSMEVNEEDICFKPPSNIAEKIEVLRSEGCPQAIILQKILPDLIEEKDSESILWCMKNFSDFPENVIVRLLMFCLSTSKSSKSPLITSPKKRRSQSGVLHNGLSNTNGENLDSDNDKNSKQFALLDAVLNLSLSDACMVTKLQALPFTSVLDLLNYLSDLLDRDSTVSLHQVMNWLCLILDSHYQEYLLSHNKEVFSMLINLKEKVLSEIECIEDLKKLRALLQKLHSGKLPLEPSDKGEKKYSVEVLHLY